MSEWRKQVGLGPREKAYLVRAQVAPLAYDRAREGLVESVLVCVCFGAHARDERLARERAVGQVVLRIVRGENTFLINCC